MSTMPGIAGKVPTCSMAEQERRWSMARDLMDAEGVEALVAYGEHETGGPAPFAPDVYWLG